MKQRELLILGAVALGVGAVLYWRSMQPRAVAAQAIKKPQPIATNVKGTVNDPRYIAQVESLGLF